MGKLLSALGLWLAYFALASLVSQLIVAGYLLGTGQLNAQRCGQVLAIIQGTEMVSADQASRAAAQAEAITQVSLEDVAAARAAKQRDLELKEQALRKGLDVLDAKTLALLQEKQDFDAARVDFEKKLREMREGAVAQGEENVRSIIANLKPRQAKDQLLQMIEKGEMNDVVSILATMTATKRTKIVSEFKTEEEAKQLDEILRLMRKGQPLVDTIGQTQDRLRQPQRSNP